MSNWIALAKLDLYNSAAAPYVDQADAQLLGTGQTDRSTQIIADITAEIRRKVSQVNQLDADPTKIPGGLKNVAIDLCVARIKKVLNIPLDKDETDTLDKHERTLNRVADGKDSVDLPDNPVPTEETMQKGTGVTSKSNRRKASAQKLKGLV